MTMSVIMSIDSAERWGRTGELTYANLLKFRSEPIAGHGACLQLKIEDAEQSSRG